MELNIESILVAHNAMQGKIIWNCESNLQKKLLILWFQDWVCRKATYIIFSFFGLDKSYFWLDKNLSIKVTSSLFFSSWASFSKVEASIDFRRFSAS